MSQHERTQSSSRRSDGTDDVRSGVLSVPYSRQLQTPELPKQSFITHSCFNAQLSRPGDPPPLPPIQNPVPFGAVLSHASAPLQASHAEHAFPIFPPERSSALTLPPLALSPQKPASFTSRSDSSPPETWMDDPTLQNLQRENADLVSAYSEAQARIAEKEKALQASSAEIERLFKDRQGLRIKVDILEAEVEELQTSTEQSLQHTAAKHAQYSQILEFSTRLQTQATSDARQRKVDHDKWEHDKNDMQQTIAYLQSEVRALRKSYGNSLQMHLQTREEESTRVNGVRSSITSTELEKEVQLLREANSAMAGTLKKVRQEHVLLSEYTEKLEGIGRSVQRHLQASQTGEDLSRGQDGER